MIFSPCTHNFLTFSGGRYISSEASKLLILCTWGVREMQTRWWRETHFEESDPCGIPLAWRYSMPWWQKNKNRAFLNRNNKSTFCFNILQHTFTKIWLLNNKSDAPTQLGNQIRLHTWPTTHPLYCSYGNKNQAAKETQATIARVVCSPRWIVWESWF